MKTIRLLAALLTAAALLAVLPAASAADAIRKMVNLGDSIGAGAGVTGYKPRQDSYECRSYANLLGEALGLEGGKTMRNYAVGGDRSANLLSRLKNANTVKDLADADLVVVSIGGNDLLACLRSLAGLATGKTVSSVEQALSLFLKADAADLETLAARPEYAETVDASMNAYESNLRQITEKLQTLAPQARVIFLLQYNPTEGISSFEGFQTLAGPLLDRLNGITESVAAEAGFEAADIPSVINGEGSRKTHILSGDIHPNAEGYKAIYEYLYDMICPPEETAAETTVAETTVPLTTAPDTTAPVTTAPDTTAPDTTAPVTTAPDTTAPETAPEAASGGGAAWIAAAAAAAVVLGGAVIVLRKRKR